MTSTVTIDSAAIFAIAVSLWQECHQKASADESLNLSNAYSGLDGLMRKVMSIATTFEHWACLHVDFDQLTEPWPYLLAAHFGKECLSILLPDNLSDFDEHDCRRIAARLRLTILEA